MAYHEKSIYTIIDEEAALKTEVIISYADTSSKAFGSITNPTVQIIVSDTFRSDFHSIFVSARNLEEIAHAVDVAIKEMNSGE